MVDKIDIFFTLLILGIILLGVGMTFNIYLKAEKYCEQEGYKISEVEFFNGISLCSNGEIIIVERCYKEYYNNNGTIEKRWGCDLIT